MGVRGTGAGQPSPALLLTVEHKSQIHCHWETESGLSGKKRNALKCPREAEAALGIPQTVRGTGQTAQWHSQRRCWCGELRDQPGAQVTVPAELELHMIMTWALSFNPSSHLENHGKPGISFSHWDNSSALRNPGGLGTRTLKRMKMDYTHLKKLFTAPSFTGVLPPRHRCLLQLLCNFCSKTQLCTSSPWELIFFIALQNK